MKLFGAQNRKKLPKLLEKHYLEKVSASRFREVKNLIKPMENQLFQKSANAIRKPYENLGQLKEIWSRIAKRPPKTLEKHYLEKVFVSRFREVNKPYKTNGKSTFSEAEKRYQEPL